MSVKLAINGFGRIGRSVMRLAQHYKDLEIVAVNDLVPAPNLAYLLQYDSVHGRFEEKVEAVGDDLVIGGRKVRVFAEKDPTKLPWKELGVDYVIESTGLFTQLEDAQKHLVDGAKRVIISAPPKGDVPVYCLGVNEEKYNPATDTVVSNASCTTKLPRASS